MFGRKKETQSRPRSPELMQLDYDKLLALRNDVETELLARGTTELETLKDKLLSIAAAQGVSLAKLFKERKKPKPKVARYRNPDNPDETWTGRGKTPQWMEEKLEAGADKEDFAIN